LLYYCEAALKQSALYKCDVTRITPYELIQNEDNLKQMGKYLDAL